MTLNDAPVAVDDVASVGENNAYFNTQLVDVVANDTDPNNDPLHVAGASVVNGAPVQVGIWDNSRLYYYSTDQDFNGTVLIDYTVSDGVGTDVGRLTVTITPQNDAPRDTTPVPGWGAPTDGIFNGTEEQPLIIAWSPAVSPQALLSDDVDPEGDTFTFDQAFGYYPGSSVTDNGNGTLTFHPAPNKAGTDYGFSYYTRDSQGAQSQPIYVVVNLANVPDPVTANDDIVARPAGPSQTVTASQMLANDTDPDPNDTRDIVSVTAVKGIASISLQPDDSVLVTYAADNTYTGRASFDYVVRDSTGNQDTGRVFLNRAPVAVADGPLVLNEGDNGVFIPYTTLLANDSDPDGDPVTVQVWNWGYAGSNVTVNAFFGGAQVTLQNGAYVGPAEFQYRLLDGNQASDIVTVSLDSQPGNDAPVANVDRWYQNSSTPNTFDRNPATNAMAGLEDQVLQFPASLLINGQSLAGVPTTGRDTDEEGTPLTVVPGSLSSFYGQVELVTVSGVPTIRFTPGPDVNSGAPEAFGYDPTRVYISYRVTDGQREGGSLAYVYLAPDNSDVPVAVDDQFQVPGGSSWTLDIGNVIGSYNVRQNDSSPDDYPFSFDAGLTTIVSVAPVSGIMPGSLSFDGYYLNLSADGSGDPIRFSYTLEDANGDQATAFVDLTQRVLGPTAFYFSGSPDDAGSASDGTGRELWGFDPTVSDSLATLVVDAETSPGFDSGNPLEITAVADGVFWRGNYNGQLDLNEFQPFGEYWSFYNPNIPFQSPFRFLGVEVGHNVFDSGLPDDEQNLGIRAGHDFWGAGNVDGPSLHGWNDSGDLLTTVFLDFGVSSRELLTDAGGSPAFAGVSSQSPGEQLFAVLPDQQVNEGFFTWDDLQLTAGDHAGDDIREVAGFQTEFNSNIESVEQRARVFFFAGDYFDDAAQVMRHDALWRVTSVYDVSTGTWSTEMQPEFMDQGSEGAVASQAYGLTVVTVPDDDQFEDERLFYFQKDATGNGQIATLEVDWFDGTGSSTGTDLFGDAFTGREIQPWQDGVVFTAERPDGTDVVAVYQDVSNGGGFYGVTLMPFQSDSGSDIEQLSVDGLGHMAFVVDQGDSDVLYYSDGVDVTVVSATFGEITDVAFAGDQLAYVMPEYTQRGPYSRLHHYNPVLESNNDRIVPTDRNTDQMAGSGYFGINNNVNIAGAMVFDGTDGVRNPRYVLDGANVIDTGTFSFSRGERLGADWVGVVDISGTGTRLARISASGSVTEVPGQGSLVQPVQTVWDEAVLGNRVLYGVTTDMFNDQRSSVVDEVRVYDSVAGTTTALLTGHLLGRAETVGSEVIFNAYDFTTHQWKLYSYNGVGATATLEGVLESPPPNRQPVQAYTPGLDFQGDANRLYWKQVTAAGDVEAQTLDRATNVVTGLVLGPTSNGDWGDGIFVGGHFIFQAGTDATTESMRLFHYSGSSISEIAGPLLADVDPNSAHPPNAYQFPYLPTSVGNRVFFMGNSVSQAQGGSGTWGVFGINQDGTWGTSDDLFAALLTPTNMGFVTGLSAVDTDLYFGAPGGGFNQVWRMDATTPGASPVQVTHFNGDSGIGQFFKGFDGKIYFARDVPWTPELGQPPSAVGLGSELWVLDNTPGGAHLVADLNQLVTDTGYYPTQLVGVPDPLEAVDVVVPT
ncbi:MAG: Ig-like domain-containing protein [Rubrivivax sp.]